MTLSLLSSLHPPGAPTVEEGPGIVSPVSEFASVTASNTQVITDTLSSTARLLNTQLLIPVKASLVSANILAKLISKALELLR